MEEIDGIKYVIFYTEIGITQAGKESAEKLDKHIKQCKGIIRKIKQESSFFGTSKVKIEFLIPENKAVEFSQLN